MNKDCNKRIVYIDILNIMAIFAVILLHHNGIVHTYSTGRAWKTSLVIETFFYWAVPVFIMITGVNLMTYRKKYDTKTFFKKRLTKVLIPFSFWLIFTTIWKIRTGQLIIDNYSIVNILNIIFENKEEPIYYFGFVILGIYITMPLLSNLTDYKYRKSIWFTVVLYFIFNSTIPVVFGLFKIKYNTNLSVQFGSYIVFVLLGYLLSTEDISRKKRLIIYFLGIISVLFRYIVTYYLSYKARYIDKTLFGYYQFHSVLLAIAVFIFIKNINWDKIIKKDCIKNVLPKITSCSFGIYLTHKIIMYYEIKILDINILSWQWRTLGAILTYFITLFLVFALKQIPFLKKIVA